MKSYYSSTQRIAVAVIGVAVGSFLLVLAAVPDATATMAYRGFMAALFVAWLSFVWRIFRVELQINATAVVVRNPLSTHRFDIRDVETFDLRPIGLSDVGIVVLRNGSRRPVWALQSGNRFLGVGRRSLQRKMSELNAHLSDRIA